MLDLFILRKESLTKSVLNTSFLIPCMLGVKIEVNIYNLLKLNKDTFLKSFSLVELISNQKSLLCSSDIKLSNRIKQNRFNVNFSSVVRKNNMMSLFKYINFFLLSELHNMYYFCNQNVSMLKYRFMIKNIMIFRILKSEFLTWLLPIHINLYYNNNLIELFCNEEINI